MNEFFDAELWVKLLLALACGAAIGLERQLRDKPAGLRTNMLICVGSALITMVSIHIALSYAERGVNVSDPGRIAAQIVSGVGFLGAGAIIQARGAVHGLTTAATIWVLAGIGLSIGGGAYAPAIAATMLLLVILRAVGLVERRVILPHRFVVFRVKANRKAGVLGAIQDAAGDKQMEFETFKLERQDNQIVVEFTARCTKEMRDALLEHLIAMDAVEGVTASG